MKKHTMKKLAGLFCLLALLLTGCGGETTNNTNSTPTQAPPVTAEPAPTSAPEETPAVTAEPEPDPVEQQSLYERFLAGSERVYGDRFEVRIWDSVNDTVVIPDGQGRTLCELVERILTPYYEAENWRKLQSVEYAYLDCGNDGVPELALGIRSTDDWSEAYDQLVIKEIDGRLQLCWLGETYYRTYEELAGTQGLIVTSGSSGYASNYYSLSAIGADGDFRTLYSEDDEYGLCAQFPGYNAVADVAAKYEDEIPSDYMLAILTVHDQENGTETVYYGADPEDAELVQTIFNEAGVTLTTEAELEQLRQAQLDARGLDAPYSDTLDWQLVDYEAIGLDNVIRYGINSVFVSTVEEFADAIASDTTIVMAPGEYNVTRWLNENLDLVPAYEYEYENEPGIHYGGSCEESEFILCGISGLTIVSEDAGNPAVIVSEPRYYNVMTLNDCSYILLKNVVMGHTVEQGVCAGDVLGVTDSYSVKVIGCDLYGCGAHGFYLSGANSVYCENCVTHDCSYGCAEIYFDSNVTFEKCTFRDSGAYTAFSISDSIASFTECTFKNLNGNMLWMDEDCYVYFTECTFDKAALDSLTGYTGAGSMYIND